jgi:hypothetical protein
MGLFKFMFSVGIVLFPESIFVLLLASWCRGIEWLDYSL